MQPVNQLQINRSGHREYFGRPAWLNFGAILFAVLLLLVVSLWTVVQSKESLQTNVESKLKTILKIEMEAVSHWMLAEKQFATFLAADVELSESIKSSIAGQANTHAVEKLESISHKMDGRTCLLMTVDGKVLASSGETWLAENITTFENQICETLTSGMATISAPIENPSGSKERQFSIVIAAPVTSGEGELVGFLGIGFDLTSSLTEVLASSRSGKTGETIAVTYSGDFISESRFDVVESKQSLPNLFTRHANGTENRIRTSMIGEPDYRGEKSVFASRWIPEYGLGLVTKMDYAEANAPVNRIVQFVWMMFGLLTLSACSTLFYRWYLLRLRTLARRAELASNRLGAYALEEMIGEGGMGIVYKAKHELLRRPTAIKILPPAKSSPESIARFEREVQFTSQLKHPNTISIYDYGRTESGLFYYAMELLEGLDLEALVQSEGPIPDGRVVEILRQACESLREAHSLKLVHRDIKPANIILCNRGGAYDTVKVLDFGMVRDRSTSPSRDDSSLSGTPMYMAPECFSNPDAVNQSADIFAIGAVGFYLLTGTPLFDVRSLKKLLALQQSNIETYARRRFIAEHRESGLAVSGQLLDLICRCVSNAEADRPESVSVILDNLNSVQPITNWEYGTAANWWKQRQSQQATNLQETPSVNQSSNDRLLAVTQTIRAENRDS